MTTAPRLHLSPKPLTQIHSAAQAEIPSRKPVGLWYAFGGAWHTLIEQNRIPGKAPGGLTYEVRLHPDARICQLTTPQDILTFTDTYGRALPWARPGAPATKRVDWLAVARAFQGLEITCLAREGRGFLDWVDIDWAVASGCVWDAGAVQSVTLA